MSDPKDETNAGTAMRGVDADRDDALRARVQAVFDQQINPSVAMHGGYITLVDVRDAKVFIEMGGGCQGCGAANLTLKAGVEAILFEEVPEVTAVIDTTDHRHGDSPYFP